MSEFTDRMERAQLRDDLERGMARIKAAFLRADQDCRVELAASVAELAAEFTRRVVSGDGA